MSTTKEWAPALGLLLLAAWAGQGETTAPGKPGAAGSADSLVWSGEGLDLLTNDVSPDGRYLSDINWDTGDLRLIDLHTGGSRDVTGRGYGAGRYAWTSSFSRDSRRVAVAWYDYEAGGHGLRVMELDGRTSRQVVPPGGEFLYVDPLDWTPSGEKIVVALRGRSDTTWHIGVVPSDSGPVRIVRTLGWLAPGGGQTYPTGEVSQDGRFVAYDYPPDLDERSRDIYALALDGSGVDTLVEHPAWDRLLGWLPDGTGILFYSDRGGRPGVWRLPVSNGKRSGEPRLVRAGIEGLIPLGFAGEAYAYGVTVERLRVHTATVDPEAGRVAVPPAPVDDPPSHASLGMDWSPDGGALAYARHDPPPEPVEVLVIRSSDGELIRELPLPPALHTSLATLRWASADEILLFGMGRGRPGVYRMDPESGRFSRLPDPAEGAAGRVKKFAVGPEGHLLYLDRAAAGGGREIVARVAATGEQRVVGTAAGPRSLAVSPDGGQLAMVARGPDGAPALTVMSTSGTGAGRTVRPPPAGRTLTGPVAWTPDGNHLLFGMRGADGQPSLWSVAVDGSAGPVRLGGGSAWTGMGDRLRVHPGGRRVAFVAGTDRGEVRLLDAF